jgi:hypothetical protein
VVGAGPGADLQRALDLVGRILDLRQELGEGNFGLVGLLAEQVPDNEKRQDQHHPDEEGLMALTHSVSFF